MLWSPVDVLWSPVDVLWSAVDVLWSPLDVLWSPVDVNWSESPVVVLWSLVDVRLRGRGVRLVRVGTAFRVVLSGQSCFCPPALIPHGDGVMGVRYRQCHLCYSAVGDRLSWWRLGQWDWDARSSGVRPH